MEFRRPGVRTTLLLNAGCYGHLIQNEKYILQLHEQLQGYIEGYGVTAITTTQPCFARMVKRLYGSRVETRASINMFISSIDAMEMLEEFDAFYPRPELYRSLDVLEKWRRWADRRGKKLYALANSGCVSFCPWHLSDNNNTAHGLKSTRMVDGTPIPDCTYWLKNHMNMEPILKGVFIRPEDISGYAHIFHGFKLATRLHFMPRLVVRAYLNGNYNGVLTDLLEQSHTYIFKPDKCLPNKNIPVNWFEKTSRCNRKCHTCNYCNDILNTVVAPYSPEMDFWHYLFDNEEFLQQCIDKKLKT
jgi:hypothetical protein